MKRIISAVVVALLAAAQSPGSTRAGIDVANAVVGDGTPASCNETTLNAAIAMSSNGQPITFNCGGPNTIVVTGKIVVGGQTAIDGGGQITLTGKLATRLFEVRPTAALTLTNVVLTQALHSTGDGSAIFNEGRLWIDGVTFGENNTLERYSGAAIATYGPVRIANSLFVNNAAGSAGAILANTAPAKVVISNTRFINNVAVNELFGYGGALWVGNGADVSVSTSTFSANRGFLGGAIHVSPQGRLTVRDGLQASSALDDNFARVAGGAIYNSGVLDVENVAFRRNKTQTEGGLGHYGGAIASLNKLTVKRGFFRENESRFGGAIFVGGQLTAAVADISDTLLTRNRAVQVGGAIYTNVTTTTLTVFRSGITHNRASAGGGIGRVNAGITINASAIAFNVAELGGGGVYIDALPERTSGAHARIVNTSIIANENGNQASGGLLNGAFVDIVHGTIVSNTGGLYYAAQGGTTLFATVLDNRGRNCDSNVAGTKVSDGGHNFATDTTCGVSKEGDALDPLLGPYASDPNTPVEYQMPIKGSPLLGQVRPCLVVDGRDVRRPTPCAIGAIEFDDTPLPPTPPPPGTARRIYAPVIVRGIGAQGSR
jgi:hypothetical protein